MNTKDPKLPVVGYGKPPLHSRFPKGQSGNPGGRPRGMTLGRSAALALKEAYRPVRVKEGDKVKVMPAMRVILRKQVDLAISGNGPALRAVTETIRAIESELAAQAAIQEAEKPKVVNEADIVRRIAFMFARVGKQQEKERQEKERREQQRQLIPKDSCGAIMAMSNLPTLPSDPIADQGELGDANLFSKA